MKYVDNLSRTEIREVNVIASLVIVVLVVLVTFWVWRANQNAELYRECLKAAERLSKNPGMCHNY